MTDPIEEARALFARWAVVDPLVKPMHLVKILSALVADLEAARAELTAARTEIDRLTRERDEARAERDARPEITAMDALCGLVDAPSALREADPGAYMRVYQALRAHAGKVAR